MANRTRRFWWRRAALGGLAVLALVMTPFVNVPTSAQAAPVTGFNAGNIISDPLFYNGNAMSASEIQSFLNQRVPTCTIGTVDYKMPGSTLRTINPVASKCLKDLRITTQSKAANAYCSSYVGAANESAAQIIYKVGKACGISQKVLLVMLEKEQTLVSDSWPTTRMFNYAMGWGCPDSGPGNTANCDSDGAGFAYQVYQSAWQYKVYQASPNRWKFKPHQNNTIQWHPNASCGTSQVYIENSATAALYIYTPYRPNQAAINAGWGTGDSCSSYGNRNFYNFYNSWFGSTDSSKVEIHSELQSTYDRLSGSNAALGHPLAEFRAVGSGIIEQRFANGTLYWSPADGVSSTRGAIRALFEREGGPTGLFGIPIGHEISESGWVRQEFKGGTAFWDKTIGASFIRGGIRTQYLAHTGAGGLSGVGGYLGLPLGVETKVGAGVYQRFELGAMYWHPSSLETWTRGGIHTEYVRLNSTNGKLGFPLGTERNESGFALQDFEKGQIYWTSQSGTKSVYGDIYRIFAITGAASGVFGAPRSQEIPVGNGVRQDFENVTAYWKSDSGVGYVLGGIRTIYDSLGGSAGKLGFPIGGESTSNGWSQQEFESGAAFWSPTTGTVVTKGAIHEAFVSQNGSTGVNGYPLTSEIGESGGVRQEFQNSTAYWSATSGASFVKNQIRADYEAAGGTSSYVGFPVDDEQSVGQVDWVKQDFQRGRAFWSKRTGVVWVKGAIREEFFANGAESGLFGFPLTSEISEGNGVRQEFENATVRWNGSEGVTVSLKR